MLTDEAICSIADRVLSRALGGSGYDRVTVRSGTDVNDEPALLIDAMLKEKAPVVKGEVTNSALAELRKTLLQNGEDRFPYLRLVHPDDVYVEGAGPSGARPRRANG